MSRNKSPRTILNKPKALFYKPQGICLKLLEIIELQDDEFEAMKLHDFDLLPQLEAAVSMNISQPTFGRILNRAYRKISRALFEGKAISIQFPTDQVPMNRWQMHNEVSGKIVCDVCGKHCLASSN